MLASLDPLHIDRVCALLVLSLGADEDVLLLFSVVAFGSVVVDLDLDSHGDSSLDDGVNKEEEFVGADGLVLEQSVAKSVEKFLAELQLGQRRVFLERSHHWRQQVEERKLEVHVLPEQLEGRDRLLSLRLLYLHLLAVLQT